MGEQQHAVLFGSKLTPAEHRRGILERLQGQPFMYGKTPERLASQGAHVIEHDNRTVTVQGTKGPYTFRFYAGPGLERASTSTQPDNTLSYCLLTGPAPTGAWDVLVNLPHGYILEERG